MVFDFFRTGQVQRFPTLIGAVMLIVIGLLCIVLGFIQDTLAKNSRRRFIMDTNYVTRDYRMQKR